MCDRGLARGKQSHDGADKIMTLYDPTLTPRLNEMLADPIVRATMRSDKVRDAELRDLLRKVRHHLLRP